MRYNFFYCVSRRIFPTEVVVACTELVTAVELSLDSTPLEPTALCLVMTLAAPLTCLVAVSWETSVGSWDKSVWEVSLEKK